MLTLEYADVFKLGLKNSPFISTLFDKHGYFRHVIGDSIIFYPKNPPTDYHSIGLTPGLNQTESQLFKDISRNRILLLAEASNSAGDYVIIEDSTHYMPLTGNLQSDMIVYCRHLFKAVDYVTGNAEQLKLSPHDFVTTLDI